MSNKNSGTQRLQNFGPRRTFDLSRFSQDIINSVYDRCINLPNQRLPADMSAFNELYNLVLSGEVAITDLTVAVQSVGKSILPVTPFRIDDMLMEKGRFKVEDDVLSYPKTTDEGDDWFDEIEKQVQLKLRHGYVHFPQGHEAPETNILTAEIAIDATIASASDNGKVKPSYCVAPHATLNGISRAKFHATTVGFLQESKMQLYSRPGPLLASEVYEKTKQLNEVSQLTMLERYAKADPSSVTSSAKYAPIPYTYDGSEYVANARVRRMAPPIKEGFMDATADVFLAKLQAYTNYASGGASDHNLQYVDGLPLQEIRNIYNCVSTIKKIWEDVYDGMSQLPGFINCIYLTKGGKDMANNLLANIPTLKCVCIAGNAHTKELTQQILSKGGIIERHKDTRPPWLSGCVYVSTEALGSIKASKFSDTQANAFNAFETYWYGHVDYFCGWITPVGPFISATHYYLDAQSRSLKSYNDMLSECWDALTSKQKEETDKLRFNQSIYCKYAEYIASQYEWAAYFSYNSWDGSLWYTSFGKFTRGDVNRMTYQRYVSVLCLHYCTYHFHRQSLYSVFSRYEDILDSKCYHDVDLLPPRYPFTFVTQRKMVSNIGDDSFNSIDENVYDADLDYKTILKKTKEHDAKISAQKPKTPTIKTVAQQPAPTSQSVTPEKGEDSDESADETESKRTKKTRRKKKHSSNTEKIPETKVVPIVPVVSPNLPRPVMGFDAYKIFADAAMKESESNNDGDANIKMESDV